MKSVSGRCDCLCGTRVFSFDTRGFTLDTREPEAYTRVFRFDTRETEAYTRASYFSQLGIPGTAPLLGDNLFCLHCS